jgi:hypothetical protein
MTESANQFDGITKSPRLGVLLACLGLVVVCAVVTAAILVRKTPVRAAAPPVAVQGGLINPPTPPTPPTPPAPINTTPTAAHSMAPGISAANASTLPVSKDGYLQVGFDTLAGFPIRVIWKLTDPVRIKGQQKVMGDLPDDIKALDRKKVAVKGFMLPVKMNNGLVTEFFLLRTQARCCYGLPVQVNEQLVVHMAGSGVKSLMDQPITISGTLHVTENHDDTGALASIYSLDGDKMDGP